MLPQLRTVRGCVINIASIHTSLTKREFTLYASSKGAMDAMTRSLALELAPDVRVNSVVPAATDTQMLRDGFNQNMEGMKGLGSCHPIGRIAKAEEVAQAVLFLASEKASFITGESLRVDGGIGACLHDPA
jgi:NAD(P)-dependent dehydrogenase (short-subunit alcohol dehydrogenase family)